MRVSVSSRIWADAINVREYRRTEMISVQWKAVLRCVSAYNTVSTEAVCVLADTTSIEIVADERKRVCSTTCRINPKNEKAVHLGCEGRQVTVRKGKEWLSGSSKGEWNCLLLHDLKTRLERGHGQTNFYLTQVMSSHGAFNTYLFPA